MRALLVNPWIYDFAAYDLWSKPLGILNIASHLKRLGCDVKLIDCLDRSHPELTRLAKGVIPKSTAFGSGHYYSTEIDKPPVFKDIRRRFKRYGLPIEIFSRIIDNESNPDIILVTSGMTYWYPAYVDAIRMLKRRFPDTPLVLGGIYPNLCYEHAKRHSGADHVYKGGDIDEIIGLVEKLACERFDRPPADDRKRLAGGYELYDTLTYATLRTSSGCPFKCSYCGWYILEKNIIREDPDLVVDNIAYLHESRKVDNFAFYDEALLYDADKHIIKIMEGLIARKIRANFHTPNGLHSRFITSEIAGLLKRSGFVRPRLSLETVSSRRQSETGGKTTNEDFLQAIDRLCKNGYVPGDIGVYLLIGLPGQSALEVEESVRFAVSCKVRVHLEEYSPIPGTPDYEKSGLPADADPLFHNNSAFPLYKPDIHREFQRVKDLVHASNRL